MNERATTLQYAAPLTRLTYRCRNVPLSTAWLSGQLSSSNQIEEVSFPMVYFRGEEKHAFPTCQAFPRMLRLRTAYNALSPPLRKLNRSTVLSSLAPSGVGVSARDASGAACGSVVPQISHCVSAGWFKNVHAGHATSFGGVAGAVGGEEDEWAKDGGGAEAARGGVGVVEGTLCRGTPQSAHLAPVGLEPGGLRKSHTSHCQLSPTWSPDAVTR